MTISDPHTGDERGGEPDDAETAVDTDSERAVCKPTLDTAPTPPGPRGLPVLGSTISLARDAIAFERGLREYGPVVGYSAFGERFAVMYDPEIVEDVLVTRNDAFSKGEFEQEFGELIAPDGLVFAEGDQWRRQRLALQSAFTPARIRSYTQVMVDETAELVGSWANATEIELSDTLSTLTLRILTQALFDLDLDATRGAVVREAAESIDAMVDRMGLISFLPEWAPRTPTERRHDRAMADLDDLVDTLIATRRDETGERDDLLSMLVDAEYPDGTQMAPTVVRDQLVTFLFAGHETTATTLTYACWLLAGHPGVQDRLRTEATTLDGPLGFDDLSDLPYTEAVVRETLRLYPPVYSLYRQPDNPLVLGGYRIDPDVTVQLPSVALQRDDRYWDGPAQFRPTRWLDEDRNITDNAPDRPDYAYFPFGGGPRHCIGMRFAMTELKLVLATMCRRVEFERVTDELDISMGLTLDPGRVTVGVNR
ncbi:cytochrome P450 [Haloarcula sp. CBA1127]|uniref:cytochrome P450 n=1 Tax=Haloarcula sp. CBA1127 TaxID=1765055 RepID=UPI00073F66BA|nr:cytochrome P450 [Haloarcula sp. CBA1127]